MEIRPILTLDSLEEVALPVLLPLLFGVRPLPPTFPLPKREADRSFPDELESLETFSFSCSRFTAPPPEDVAL